MHLLITRDQIAARIQEIAANLKGPFTLIAILKGALCFTADLMRHLDPTCELEWIRCSSYTGTKRGALSIEGLDTLDLHGKDILILDDIFDSGATLTQVVSAIQEKGPKSVQSVVLLQKEVPRETSYCPNHILFSIPDRFVVGYGLDHNEQYRGLPDIYILQKN